MKRISASNPGFLIKLAMVLLSAVFSREALCQTEAQVVPAAGIYVIYVRGKAQVKPADKSPVAATSGMELKEGDVILTGPDSYVEIAYGREFKNASRVDAASRLALEETSPESTHFSLKDGKVFSLIQKLPEGAEFTVSTPTAVAGIRGTGFEVRFRDNLTRVVAYEGIVYVRGIDEQGRLTKELAVSRGLETFVRKFEAPGMPEKIPALEERGFKRFKAEAGVHLKLFEQRKEKERDKKKREQERRQALISKESAEKIKEGVEESIGVMEESASISGELEAMAEQSEQRIKEMERSLEKSDDIIERVDKTIDKKQIVIDSDKVEQKLKERTREKDVSGNGSESEPAY